MKQLAIDVKEECGMNFRPDKLMVYIMRKEYKSDNWDELRGEIKNGEIKDSDGTIYRGLPICNILVGEPTYVETYLKQKKNSLEKKFNMVHGFLDLGMWSDQTLQIRKM